MDMAAARRVQQRRRTALFAHAEANNAGGTVATDGGAVEHRAACCLADGRDDDLVWLAGKRHGVGVERPQVGAAGRSGRPRGSGRAGGTGFAFRACRSWRACFAFGARSSRGAGFTLGACRSRGAGFTLGARGPGGPIEPTSPLAPAAPSAPRSPWDPGGPGDRFPRACLAGRPDPAPCFALRSCRSHGTGRALRPGRPLRPRYALRPCRPNGTLGTLAPCQDERDRNGNQGSECAHGIPPSMSVQIAAGIMAGQCDSCVPNRVRGCAGAQRLEASATLQTACRCCTAVARVLAERAIFVGFEASATPSGNSKSHLNFKGLGPAVHDGAEPAELP